MSGRLAAIYRYVDGDGHLLHETVRYIPKSFRQRRPDPARPGRYIDDLKGVTPVLYHLPQVLAAIQQGEPIYLCEGEKDADNLQQAFGVTATTCPMGSGYWKEHHTETLRGASVVILTDHDKAGAAHALKVTSALVGVVARLKVVTTLHTNAPKSDVSDWLAAGGTREAFVVAVDAIAWGTHPTPTPKPTPVKRTPWYPPTGHEDYDRVADALSYIPADERSMWITIGMSLCSSGEPWAEGLWDSWSQGSAKYNARTQERTWKGFKPGDITLGTLFFEAERHGYRPSVQRGGNPQSSAVPDEKQQLAASPHLETPANVSNVSNVSRGVPPNSTFPPQSPGTRYVLRLAGQVSRYKRQLYADPYFGAPEHRAQGIPVAKLIRKETPHE